MRTGAFTLVQNVPSFITVPLAPAPTIELMIARTPRQTIGLGASVGLLMQNPLSLHHLVPVDFAFKSGCYSSRISVLWVYHLQSVTTKCGAVSPPVCSDFDCDGYYNYRISLISSPGLLFFLLY